MEEPFAVLERVLISFPSVIFLKQIFRCPYSLALILFIDNLLLSQLNSQISRQWVQHRT